MPNASWRLEGAWIENCNCAFGCPCDFSAPGVLESDVEPNRNPVTGAPHRIQVLMPEGFEHRSGEVASSNIASSGAIRYETHRSHGTLANVAQTPHGVEA